MVINSQLTETNLSRRVSRIYTHIQFVLYTQYLYRKLGVGLGVESASLDRLRLSFASSVVDVQFVAEAVSGEDAELVGAQL